MEWIYFSIFVVIMLVLDLGVFHKKGREVEYKEALIWTGVWIALALGFNVILYFTHGPEAALNFLAGYLIEESLSVDNLFVFLLIFNYFAVPKENIHRVLFYGVVGALVARGIFIFTGVELVERFPFIMYFFGAFLMYSGIKIIWEKDKKTDLGNNYVLKLLYRYMPITKEYQGDHFFVRQGGKLMATPLFVVLLAVDVADIVFAIDSVPAILAITNDPFIIFTSNVFAVMGLRTLYFVLTRLMHSLYYLHEGIAALLVFIGLKMLLAHYVKISVTLSLLIIFSIIVTAVVASLLKKRQNTNV